MSQARLNFLPIDCKSMLMATSNYSKRVLTKTRTQSATS